MPDLSDHSVRKKSIGELRLALEKENSLKTNLCIIISFSTSNKKTRQDLNKSDFDRRMNFDFINIKPNDYRFWLTGIGLLVGSILFFLGGPDYNSPRAFSAFWNLGHIIYFSLLSYALSKWTWLSRYHLIKRWLFILSVTLIIGTLIELVQYHIPNRTADPADVIRDLSGSFLFLSFSSAYSAGTGKLKIILRTIAIMLLLVLLRPLATSLLDEAIAWRQFPLLSSFETPFELDRWQGSAPMTIRHIPSIATGHILQITLSKARYSGVDLKYFPRDWRKYKTLELNIYNPQAQPLPITCRIHDLQHAQGMQQYSDRYNHRFLLTAGWNKIDIDLNDVAFAPRHRKMDMGQIQNLDIFVMSLPQPRVIFLDNIKLLAD
ncbi:MAG TPA: VanZ family protein [Gammaproteobacteria bacterium]|nr:VanZ family protein [Gammaproteobacteria bacterium]